MSEEFNKIYNELSELNEKWYTGDDPTWQRVWFSDSASELKQFIFNIISEGKVRGLRANIAPDSYAVARALDLNHDGIDDTLDRLYLDHADWEHCEHITIGIPKFTDFDLDNFESNLDEPFEDDAWENKPSGGYETLVADCGDFEIDLYGFRSKQFPEHRSTTKFPYFEGSETERIFKPYIKKIYMYKEK